MLVLSTYKTIAMSKFETVQELRDAIAANSQLGMIGGIPVIDSGSKEIRRGFIGKDLYNQALLIGATMNLNKSEIGNSALLALRSACSSASRSQWVSERVSERVQKVEDLTDARENREFRYFVGNEIWQSLGSIWANMSNSKVTQVALEVWIYSNSDYYQDWVMRKMKETALTQAEIEQAIFDKWKLEGWVKRLELSDRKGQLVKDKKLI